MDSTHLDLLTRDGKLSVTFRPPLDVQHSKGLVYLCDQSHLARELRQAIELAAGAWRRKVEFDE